LQIIFCIMVMDWKRGVVRQKEKGKRKKEKGKRKKEKGKRKKEKGKKLHFKPVAVKEQIR